MVGVFMILYFIFSENIKNRFKILSIFVICWVIFMYMGDYIRETYLFQRFHEIERRYAETTGGFTLYNIAYWIGRRDIVMSFADIIQTGGFLGIGPFVVWQLNGSNIPFHNLYYALYLNFGFIGFSFFAVLFGRIVMDLFRIYRNDEKLRGIAMIFLLMFLILLAEQMKVSSYRIPFGIFMWWYLFALFSSLQNLRHVKPIPFIEKRRLVL
jgi:hypothetical protein